MPFVQCLWLAVFVDKRVSSHLKTTYNICHGKQSASCDQALDKLSEKLDSRLLVQDEHGFQKGAQCASGHRSSKKPGLDRIKTKRKKKLNKHASHVWKLLLTFWCLFTLQLEKKVVELGKKKTVHCPWIQRTQVADQAFMWSEYPVLWRSVLNFFVYIYDPKL